MLKKTGINIRTANAVAGSINKEFIPVFLIIASPVLAFANGYGIKTLSVGIDLYYILPALFAVFMNIRAGTKMPNMILFVFLALLNAGMTIPCLQMQEFSRVNYEKLVISYGFIICFFILVSASFFGNDPYFASYYRTRTSAYRLVYIITGIFFTGVAVFHLVLFVKIFQILRFTFG
jgi:hypothetical protein